jgi:fibronectin-binding autotransporter adhesin
MARRNSISLLVMIAAALAYMALVILAAPAAHATVYTWDKGGPDTNWATVNNWSAPDGDVGTNPTVVPGGATTDTVKFTETGAGTVAVGANRSISDIVFDNVGTAYSLTGALTLTLNSGSIQQKSTVTASNTIAQTIAGTGTLNIGVSGGSLTLGGVISGFSGLNITGSGLVTLGTGTNTYTGTTSLNGGTLKLGGNANLPDLYAVSVTNGALDINNKAEVFASLTLNNGTLKNTGGTATNIKFYEYVNRGTANQFLLGITSYGTSVVDALAGIQLNDNSNQNRLFTVNDGTLTINAPIGNGGGSSTLVKDGPGTLFLNGALTMGGLLDRAGTLVLGVNPPGNFNLGDASTGSNPISLLLSGTLTMTRNLTVTNNGTGTTIGGNNTSGTTIYSGTIGLSKDISVTAASGGSVTFSNTISGTNFGINKVGAGTVNLTKANTFTGMTTVSEGTLSYGIASALSTGGLTVNGSTAILDLNNFTDSVGAVTLTQGTIQATGATSGNGILTSTASFAVKSGTISAKLAGAVAMTKDTSGTVILSGANTLSGNTTISDGTLTLSNASGSALGTGNLIMNGGWLNGAGSAAGTLTLNAGTLGGSVTIGAVTAVTSGPQTICPGDGAVGVLHTGTLTLVATTTLDFSQITSDSILDQILSTGQLNATGTINVVLPAGLTGAQYVLIDANAGGTAVSANFTTTTPGYLLTVLNGDLLLRGALNTWSDADGSVDHHWSTAGNWTNGVPAADGSVMFNGSGNGTVSVTGVDSSVGSINFDSASLSYIISASGGNLKFDNSGNAATITMTGATLAQEISAPVTLAGNLQITSNAQGLTMSGGIGESTAGKSLTLLGGLLTLGGTNAYTGGTNLSGGTLQISSGATLSSSSPVTLAASTLLDLAGNSLSIGTLSAAGGTIKSTAAATLTVNQGSDQTLGVKLTGAGLALVKAGNSKMTLTQANDLGGGTTVSAGTLALAPASNSTVVLGSVTMSGGTLSGFGTVGAIDASGAASGAKIMPDATKILTTGTLTLNANTTLDFSNWASATSGAIVSTGTLDFTGGGQFSVLCPGGLGVGTINTLLDAASLGTATTSHINTAGVPSNYNLTINSGGDLILTVLANYWTNGGSTGNWNLAANWKTGIPSGTGATAAFTNDGDHGSSPVNLDANITVNGLSFGTSAPAYTISTDSSKTLTLDTGGAGSATISVGTGADVQTINVPITLNSNLSITNNGSNSLTLGGPISGSGKTVTLTNGLVTLGAQDILANVSTLTLTAGTVAMGGNNQAIGTLSGAAGTITGGSGLILTIFQATNQTFSGKITGQTGVTKSGIGILTLGAASDYTGATTISTGVLKMGVANALSASTNVTMNGGTLDLAGNNLAIASLTGSTGSIGGTGGILTVNGAGTYNGTIGGAVGLTKGGSGTLTLNTADNYTGGTKIYGGTLQLGMANAIPATNVTVSGGILNRGGYALALTPSSLSLGGGTISGNGTLSLNAGTLTSSGNSLITGGNLNTNAGNGGSNGNKFILVISSGTLTIDDVITRDGTNASGDIVKTGPGNLIITNSNNKWLCGNNGAYDGSYTGGVITLGGSRAIGGDTKDVDLTAFTLGANTQFNMGGYWQSVHFASTDATSTIDLQGGTLRLAGDYGGVTHAGLLTDTGDITGTGTFLFSMVYTDAGHNGTQTVTGTTNTVPHLLMASGNLTGAGSIAVTSDIILQSGTLGLALTGNVSVTKSGAGVLYMSAANKLPSGGALTVNNGTLNLQGNNQQVTTLTMNGGTLAGSGTLLMSTSGSILAGLIQTPLAGVGKNVVKSGPGTVTLTADNTYSGTTTVSEGKLVINGSLATSSLILSGGTIGGTGTVGSVAVGDGAVVAPGSSPGVFHVGNISFSAGSSLDIELAAIDNYDVLASTGTVTLALNSNISVSLLGGYEPAQDNIFTIITASTITDNGANLTLPGLTDGKTWKTWQDTGSGLTAGQIQVIPEPATIALMGLGLAGLVSLRRRSRKA